MRLNVLFAAGPDKWEPYQSVLPQAIADCGLDANVRTKFADPATVDYIVLAPNGPVQDFRPFTRTKAVLNLWAGVEDIVFNPTLSQPLTRMVDEGLSEGMVEWVTGHVLRHHLGMDRHIFGQDGEWRDYVPPLARDRKVGILGLGTLGRACAKALGDLNFDVSGWSRRQKEITGVDCQHGDDGLRRVLEASDIVVLLLPDTPATQNIMNARRLALLPKGAVVINPGRGTLVDDAALMAALTTGHISHATLDAFRIEPLPADSPYWAHPNVTVTPHIASETRPKSASRAIAENIRRSEAGEPLLYLVDRVTGY